MAKLEGQTIAASFDQVLIVDHADGISASLQAVESADTDGASSALKIATNKVEVIPGSNDANAFEVSQTDGTAILTINSTTPSVLVAGSGVKLYFSDAGGEYIAGDGTDLTITSGAKINLTATSDVHVANGTGVVIGHTAQETISIGDGSTDLVPEVQVLGTAQADASLMLAAFSATATSAGAPLVALVKGGNASIGSHTIVTDGEELGNIIAYGDDGVDLESPAASIQFEVDGTPGAGDMPGRILFNTSPDGGSVLTEAMRISQDGTQNQQANYIVNEQGRQDHVANTMPAPYYRFDGVDDYIYVADDPDLELGTAPFSISVRIKRPDSGATGTIVGKRSAGNYWLWRIVSDGSLRFLWDDGDADAVDTTVTGLDDDKEHHLVLTRDGTTFTYYIDGAVESTHTATMGDCSNSNQFQIGVYNTSVNPFEGQISDLKLFNKALTATEVKELYSGASVPFKYKGANQTELVTDGDMQTAGSWTAAGDWDVDSTSANEAHFSDSTPSYSLLKQSLTLTKGKKYRISFDINDAVGGGNAFIFFAGNSASALFNEMDNYTTFADGSHSLEYITISDSTEIRIYAHTDGVAFDMVNLSIVPIGAVAEYDGSGAGEKIWGDKSGNDLHGTVTGATLENTPYDSGTEYEEGTWTPQIYDSIGGTATTTGSGTYTKIGREVTCRGLITNINTTGLTSGNDVWISGMPFTVAVQSHQGMGSVAMDTVAFSGHLSIYPEGDQTSLRIAETSSGGAIDYITVSQITDDTGDIYISFSYMG